MNAESEPGSAESFAVGKALVVLYDFHALRSPGDPVHSHKLSKPVLEFELVSADALYPPEVVLTQRGLSAVAKAQAIGQQFRGMLRPIAESLVGGEPYNRVVELCELARQRFNTEEDLLDGEGQPLSIIDILPPREVVDAMAEDFVAHNRKRCPPLEEFIVHLSAA